MKVSLFALGLATVLATTTRVEAKLGRTEGGRGPSGVCKEAIKETCTQCFVEGQRPDKSCIVSCVADAPVDSIPQECKDALSGGGPRPPLPGGGNETQPGRQCKEAIGETCAECFVEGEKPNKECIESCVLNAPDADIPFECKEKLAEKVACREQIEEACSDCFSDPDASKKTVSKCVKECVAEDDSIPKTCFSGKKRGKKGRKAGKEGRGDDSDGDNEDGSF